MRIRALSVFEGVVYHGVCVDSSAPCRPTLEVDALLRRWDHANIFLIIAGSYTPFAMLLPRNQAITLLAIVWSGAILGVLFRILWLGAPRWLYTFLYLAMGWAAVGWLTQFWAAGGPAVVLLIGAGGLVYSLGAIAYATKRPQLSPTWFGFHEVFHACTVIAALLHAVAIGLAVFRVS